MTDPSAVGELELIGDAHEHLKNNDCGLTAGALFSGAAVAEHPEQVDADGRGASVAKRMNPSKKGTVPFFVRGAPVNP